MHLTKWFGVKREVSTRCEKCGFTPSGSAWHYTPIVLLYLPLLWEHAWSSWDDRPQHWRSGRWEIHHSSSESGLPQSRPHCGWWDQSSCPAMAHSGFSTEKIPQESQYWKVVEYTVCRSLYIKIFNAIQAHTTTFIFTLQEIKLDNLESDAVWNVFAEVFLYFLWV